MIDFEILYVDDDRDILFLVQKYLTSQGYSVTVIDNGIKALSLIKQKNFDLVFTDFRMPEFDGLELLMAIKEYRPETEVVIVTGYGTMESAIKAIKFGSYDYIQKPFKLDSLKVLVDRVIEEKKLRDENIILKRRLKDRQRYRFGDLIGMSLKMQGVYDTIEKISPSNIFALIKGESGTGKELVARTIHEESSRKDRPFIPVNCGSVHEGVSESRLFDHVVGLLEASEGGTIYLDEVTEISSSLQSKLLEVFKDKKIGGYGNGKTPETHARVLSGSKMDLEEAQESGIIKKELYLLLGPVSIQLPPLRERKEDIFLLLNHFLYKFNARDPQRLICCVSPETMDVLLDYHWPGNIIQLGNVIERAFSMGIRGTIHVKDLPPEIKTFEKTFQQTARE